MPGITLTSAGQAGFPVGTKVGAYPLKGANIVTPISGPPPGAPVESPEVQPSGLLEYANLVEGTFYLLAAEVAGTWRYEKIYVPFSTATQPVISAATGDFAITTAGRGFRVKEGENAKMGTGTLAAGKVTVANKSVTASSRIFIQRTGPMTNAGALTVVSTVAATSFTVESANAADAGTFNYMIFEPA
jgi:hypothetical protein